MARQVFSLLPGYHPSVGAHRRPQRVGSAFSHHLVQVAQRPPQAASVGGWPPGPRTDFASPSTDGLPGLRGACIAGDRFSLSPAMLRGVNHPSEATETPIEIQLRALRTTLGDDLVQDLEPIRWRRTPGGPTGRIWPTSPPGWPTLGPSGGHPKWSPPTSAPSRTAAPPMPPSAAASPRSTS